MTDTVLITGGAGFIGRQWAPIRVGFPATRRSAKETLGQLNRHCGPLIDSTTAQIQALPVDKLEALAVGAAFAAGVALLDFQGPADLAASLAADPSGIYSVLFL